MSTNSDPIADMLTRIRNASSANHERVEVPGSKLKRSIAQVLKEEGYIRDFEWVPNAHQGTIRIHLKYGPSKTKVITGLRRISKPGRRVYAQRHEVPKVLGGLGVAVLSTPKGILTDRQAREQGVGGEVLCFIW